MTDIIEPLHLTALETKNAGDETLLIKANDYLSLVADVKVDIEVCVGKTNITVQQLKQLQKNQVIRLDTLTNEPVELKLNGKVIALGELVVSNNNYAIKLHRVEK